MTFDFDTLSKNSRIWIYQANRKLTSGEQEKCLKRADDFLKEWAAHGNALKASAEIKNDFFLVIGTDESFNMASGCSIDTQVRFIQELGVSLGVDFFQRTDIAFLIDDKVELVALSKIKAEVESERISPETLFFDNTVQRKDQLPTDWCVEAGKTWLNRYFKQSTNV